MQTITELRFEGPVNLDELTEEVERVFPVRDYYHAHRRKTLHSERTTVAVVTTGSIDIQELEADLQHMRLMLGVDNIYAFYHPVCYLHITHEPATFI